MIWLAWLMPGGAIVEKMLTVVLRKNLTGAGARPISFSLDPLFDNVLDETGELERHAFKDLEKEATKRDELSGSGSQGEL